MKTLKDLTGFIGFGTLLLLSATASTATSVSGTISTNTTWTLAGSPYIVTGDVYVERNVLPVPVLTIEPGVTVKFNAGVSLLIGFNSPGDLQAVGTSTAPITFTANTATPAAGFWRGVRFYANAASTSKLAYVTVIYGGLTGNWGGVQVIGSSPTLQNVTLQSNAHSGISINGGSPAISFSTISSSPYGIYTWNLASPSLQTVTISGSASYAISQDSNQTLGAVSALTLTGNGINAVELRAVSIAISTTWRSLGWPYVVPGDVYVEKNGAPVPVLTVEAGATVKFGAGKSLFIGNSYPGELQAVGTSASQITFTANSASPTPGFWRAIRFRPNTTPTSQLAYATVSYGGLAGNWGAIFLESSSPTISNVTVQNNAHSGIGVNGGSPVITNCTVTGNGWGLLLYGTGSPSVSSTTISNNTTGGVWVQAPTAPTLASVTITNNVGFAISQEAKITFGAATGVTASGNTNNAVEMRASTADVSTTWRNFGLPYVLPGDVYVEKNGAPVPVLTVEAGATVKFGAGKSLFIGNSYPGELQAVGTSASQITFTANSASPTPGFWRAIRFRPGTAPTSQLAYATVTYGGLAGNWGGIYIESSSPTISNVTAQNNLDSGIRVNGGSPVITSSTVTGNGWGLMLYGTGSPSVSSSTISNNATGGVWVQAPAAPTLASVTITNNVGFAISQEAKITFGAATGVTASGNTNNAVEMRASTADVSTTWRNFGLPYVLPGDVYVEKNGAPVPVLTVEAGATVKFGAGKSLFIGNSYPGELQAVGTSASQITFTANSASPTPGFWRSIRFRPNTTPTSQLAYATVSYGGLALNWGAIFIESSSPTISNVTAQNNVHSGIEVNGGSPVITSCAVTGNGWGLVLLGTGSPSVSSTTLSNNTTGGIWVQAPAVPAIVSCYFSNNPAGLVNSTTANVLIARFNYWNEPSGPSGSGPGSGQSVSAGVKFEPWLIAAPSLPNFFNSFNQKNRTFNPALSINTTIAAGSTLPGSWTTAVVNTGGTTVRTFTGPAAPDTIVWDGKDDSGTDQPDGPYTYTLASTATTGDIATTARGQTVLDRTKQLTISNLATAPQFFSPNADGIQDATTVTGTNSFDDTTLTVNVKNPVGSVVRTSSTSGSDLAYTWDGKDVSAVVQPDAVYMLEVVAVNGTASATSSVIATLDNTPPVAAITAPVDAQVVSNVYTGVTNATVTGSAVDLNFTNWSLDYGSGGSPTSFILLGSGTSPVTGSTLGTWATAPPFANGLYTLRLQAWDQAGNRSVTLVKPTVGNFSVSQSGLQLNASAGNTATYTSIVPFTLTETLVLKNAAGQVVRTVVSIARDAGTFPDVWNGKNDSAGFIADGLYRYYATVTDGTHTFTWDQTNQYWNDYYSFNDGLGIQAWDPFNNSPLTFSYNFSQPSRVSIGLTPYCFGMLGGCTPPNLCLAQDKYEESGPHTITWAGVDAAGGLRLDICNIGIITNRVLFSKNAIVLFGTKPAVTNVTVTPAFYGPAVGTQTVGFNLATFQNQTATVTVTFLNQGSLSVLRTVTLTGQSPGAKLLTWDGLADNGMWVAPGFYTVTVTATDSFGNQAQGQILTTIQY